MCVRVCVDVRVGVCVCGAVVCVVVEQQCFSSVNGGVEIRTRVQILSVQIHPSRVSPGEGDIERGRQ